MMLNWNSKDVHNSYKIPGGVGGAVWHNEKGFGKLNSNSV